MNNYKILFSCGDRSADKYLCELLKKLNKINLNIEKYVLGGENSKPFCDNFVADVVSYDAHGFFSPFVLFKKFLQLIKKIKKILFKKIDLVVLLDYYGFNIKIAKLAKKYNIPVLYYITPQVWATRKYRLKKIKKYVDYVINIYPFEPQLYKQYGITTEYYGHPIMDIVKPSISESKKYKNLVGIFPGSRAQVIKWNLPQMLKIAEYYFRNYDNNTKFIIFGFPQYEKLYKKIITKFQSTCQSTDFLCNVNISYNSEYRDKIIFAISVSGTVVLENVLYNIPTVVVYKLPFIMYWLIKIIIAKSLNYISLPNIILDKFVVPEFIQYIDIKKVCEYINSVLADADRYQKITLEFDKIKSILKNPNSSVTDKVVEKICKILVQNSKVYDTTD